MAKDERLERAESSGSKDAHQSRAYTLLSTLDFNKLILPWNI